MCSNEFGNCNSSLRHDEQEKKSISEDMHWTEVRENLSWQGELCFEKILDPSLEIKQMRSGSSNSKEGVENSGLNGGDSISKLERADSQAPHISRSPATNNNKKKPSKQLINRRGSIEKSSETKVQTDKVDLALHDQSLDFDQVSGGYLRKPTHGSNDKENEGKGIAENGFIITRKNKFLRTNYENSVRVPGEVRLQCSRNKCSNTTTGNEKKGVGRNKSTANVDVKQCEAKAGDRWKMALS